jgi:hypothetical protein
MGGIHEELGNKDESITMYHKSSECATSWRESHEKLLNKDLEPLLSLANGQLSQSSAEDTGDGKGGGMELCIAVENVGKSGDKSVTDFYNSIFPPYDNKMKKKEGNPAKEQMDLDIALTFHQIAQMYQ